MAGPGIRAWELARTLAERHPVTLAVPGRSDLQPDNVQLVSYREPGSDLAALIGQADVLVGQGAVFLHHPVLLAHDLPLAIDLYDPMLLESLDLYADLDIDQARAHHERYQHLTDAQLARGDFFFCATERQRDYWLGALTAAGRITPAVVRACDRDLRMLIDCVPSGIATEPPQAGPPVLRGVHPSIQNDDILLIWAGGLWDWFDPALLVQAMAAVRAELPRLKLCFFAGARPNPDGEPFRTRTYTQAHSLAAQVGVLDQTVIFLDVWVPYAERGRYLREADIGVSAHQDGIETRMSFRTRLLDYLWAGLPVICSAGDSLGEDIGCSGGGANIAPHDLEGWIVALRRAATDAAWRASCRANVERLAQSYTWAAVAQPLAAFCAQPRRLASACAGTATQTAQAARIDELSRALEEREQYNRHLETQYQQAVRQLAAQPRRRSISAHVRYALGRLFQQGRKTKR
jgi:hypothetical protein